MNEETKICVRCKKEYTLIFRRKLPRAYKNEGIRGGTREYFQIGHYTEIGTQKRFISQMCHDCRCVSSFKRRGSMKRYESTKPIIKKAYETETIAKERFERLGFEVTIAKVTGPDLVCTLGNWIYTVEVKPANLCNGSWQSPAVCKNRKNDDLVAIVLPNKYVYIDSMEHHLASCGKFGHRTVTSIVKEFGLSPLPQT